MTVLYAHATGPWPADHYSTPALAYTAAVAGDTIWITEPGTYTGSGFTAGKAGLIIAATVPGVIWACNYAYSPGTNSITRSITFRCGMSAATYYYLYVGTKTNVLVEDCTFAKGTNACNVGRGFYDHAGVSSAIIRRCIFDTTGENAAIPHAILETAAGVCTGQTEFEECVFIGAAGKVVDITVARAATAAQTAGFAFRRCTFVPASGPVLADDVGCTVSMYDCQGPDNAAMGISITGARATLGTIQSCSLGGFACAAGKAHGGSVVNSWLHTVDVSGTVAEFSHNGYETLTAGAPDATNVATTSTAAFVGAYPAIELSSSLQGRGDRNRLTDRDHAGVGRTGKADIGCRCYPWPQLRDSRRPRNLVQSWQARAA